MNAIKSFRYITAVLLIFIVSLVLPSCSSTRVNKAETKKHGLLLQDKSEYSRNKKHFKGSKAFKSQKKRIHKNKKYRRRF